MNLTILKLRMRVFYHTNVGTNNDGSFQFFSIYIPYKWLPRPLRPILVESAGLSPACSRFESGRGYEDVKVGINARLI